jgi:hypothetical protein
LDVISCFSSVVGTAFAKFLRDAAEPRRNNRTETERAMDEAVLREKIGEMLSAAQGTTVLAGADLVGQAAPKPSSGLQREMTRLEDGLDRLRLAIKYLVFDLEATKRENRLLRGLLD